MREVSPQAGRGIVETFGFDARLKQSVTAAVQVSAIVDKIGIVSPALNRPIGNLQPLLDQRRVLPNHLDGRWRERQRSVAMRGQRCIPMPIGGQRVLVLPKRPERREIDAR